MLNEPSNYARFYKCDLHMRTPFDLSHWQEETTRSSHENSEQNIREIACSYLRACHAAGLEVIAITDHNFAYMLNRATNLPER